MQEFQLNNLITLCQTQDKVAFEKVFNFIQPKIFMICKRYLSNQEDQFDVLQDICVKIYSKINQFDSQKGKFEAWVYRISTNECFKFIQRNHRHEYCYDTDFLNSISDKEEVVNGYSTNDTKKVYKAIDKLKKGQKTILHLYLMEGYTHHEIASILDISVNTSKSQLSRAKDRLRDLILKESPNTGVCL